MASDFKMGGVTVKTGERKNIKIAVSNLYDGTDLSIPVEVIRGKEEAQSYLFLPPSMVTKSMVRK